MKAERLFRVLGLTDPALVEEAAERRRRAVPWKRWGALAACLALAVGLGFGWRMTGGFGGYGGGMSGSSGGDSGSGSGESGGVMDPGAPSGELPAPGSCDFLWYYGPVLPLTTVEDPAGLTAERTVAWDMDREALQNKDPQGTAVEDMYILRNNTAADITVTAAYPFAGSFYDSGRTGLPAAEVDGAAVEPALCAGPASGGYQNASGLNVPYYRADLERLDSWEEYKILLEDGQYLDWALGEAPALDMPVTVYEFSDFAAPLEQYPAATQAMSFKADREKTRIFTYGINGLARSGDSVRYDYFVPDGVRHSPELKLLVVLGEDIGEYTLQGYQDGGCTPGEELEDVRCTVTRTETTLDAVVDRLCAYYEEFYSELWMPGQGNPFETFSQETYRRAVKELLYQGSLLSDAPLDLFTEGRLDDVLDAALNQDRVLYLTFPVTVPAGGSAEVRCTSWKMPGSTPPCADPEQADLQGYDLATRLGSGLNFTAQRAVLMNTENVELAGQNFGFDPEGGVTEVELDLEQEHYYMEILEK